MALGRLTHNHTPFSGAAWSQGLAGKGHSETQPLFPQLRATLKGHCCSRGPHGMGWGPGVTTWHPSFSLAPVLLLLLSHRNWSQGYSLLQKKKNKTKPKFLCPNLHLRVCFWEIQSESNWHTAGGGVIHWRGALVPRRTVFLLRSFQDLPPRKEASFLQWNN